jgi:hypothetical protein
MANDLIPVNEKGKPTDLEYSVTLASLDEARSSYMRAVQRMQNPGIWHDLAGWASASFKLVNAQGLECYRPASEGDYIRIDVPGPGPEEGGGYDWVKVEKVEEYIGSNREEEWTGMKVRPCNNPRSATLDTAHFFREDATSTFIMERKGNQVTAFYHGRNELPNTATPKLADNIRNAMVAAGAIIGLSETQWSALSKGFLADESQVGPTLS